MRGDYFKPDPLGRGAPAAVFDRRLLSALRGFYIRGFFLFFLGLEILIEILLRPARTMALSSLAGLFLLAVVDGHFLARFHYRDAVRNGPGFLLKRLQARPFDVRPGPQAGFEDALERMREATAVPRIKLFVSPHSSIDAVAFIEPDGGPALVVTDALLSDLAPPEIEAVSAQALARLGGKEAGTRTLLCGLADFFVRLGEDQFPSSPRMASLSRRLALGLEKRLRRIPDPRDELRADEEAARLGGARPLAGALAKAYLQNAPELAVPRTYALLGFAPEGLPPAKPGRPAEWPGTRPSILDRLRALEPRTGEEPALVLRRARGVANDGAIVVK